MKKFFAPALVVAALLFGAPAAFAQQVGVNNPTPHPSAVLDVASTTQGLLAPRMNAVQRAAINGGNPATGLLVYQTDGAAGFYFYNGAAWVALTGAGTAGPVGPQGPQGVKGDTGDAGAAGPIGPQGPIGLTGPAGAPGSQGPIGLTGPAGAAGAAGAQGAQGLQGPIGLTGPAGSTGAQGLTGATGNTGAQGIPGATGNTGPAGPAGPGVPTGGTAGQVLSKVDGTNFNTTWVTPGASSGARVELLARKIAATQALPQANSVNAGDVLVFENVATTPTTGTYNTSTNTYTAGVAGVYLIQVKYAMVEASPANNTVGTWAYVEVNGGSSTVNNVYPPYISNGSLGSNLPSGLKGIGGYTYTVILNQNDTVRLRGLGQNSSVQQTMSNNGGCQLMVVKM